MHKPVLVIGSTGYVGGRLAPLLLNRGYLVRTMSRNVGKVLSRPWGRHHNLEAVRGDMHDPPSVRRALQGCEAVYYLVHSMEERQKDFTDADRRAAYSMVKALKGSGVERVIYLSGLLPNDPHLSAHLRSRGEVEEILSLAETPLTTLRAAQLIGAGSASFEMIRSLVDRFPIMVTPRWMHVRTQPIAMADALAYLLGVLEHPETASQSYDIGGPDIVSYEELFILYAKAAGLRRRVLLPIPFMTLGLSASLIRFLTPMPGALARPLVEGMRNEVVCSENRIRKVIPVELTPIKAALERALGKLKDHRVRSSWSDAGGLPPVPEWVVRGDAGFAGAAVYTDAYSIRLAATPAVIWRPIVRIGGSTGWYGKNMLWKLRGVMDKLVGGPGLQRGRRSPEQLYVGDGLDFWRVLDVQPEKRLLLLTEMRLPGEGVLSIRLEPCAPGLEAERPACELLVVLYFKPRGLPGFAYWHAVTPFHRYVFKSMLRTIAATISAPVLHGPVRLAPFVREPEASA